MKSLEFDLLPSHGVTVMHQGQQGGFALGQKIVLPQAAQSTNQ